MWQQSLTDSGLNWIRGTGHTPTPNTGPDGDHTTTQGKNVVKCPPDLAAR